MAPTEIARFVRMLAQCVTVLSMCGTLAGVTLAVRLTTDENFNIYHAAVVVVAILCLASFASFGLHLVAGLFDKWAAAQERTERTRPLTRGSSPQDPVAVFYSYSDQDEELRVQLSKHLSSMKTYGIVEDWSHRDMVAGDDWEAKLIEKLESANIILLLISADFLSSEYCMRREVPHALSLQNAGRATVIPIILRPVDWQHTPFASFQALPRDGRPVVSWRSRDEAFEDVARGLRKAIGQLRLGASA